MTVREWLISLLIVLHVVAVAFAAIPTPRTVPLESMSRSDGDPIAARFEPPLTAFATVLNSAQRWTLRRTTTLRRVFRPYISGGIPQNWSMFSNVLVAQRYLRLDYTVDAPGKASEVYRQLVYPSQAEGELRFTYPSADKAVRVLMGSFLSRLRDEDEGESSGEQIGDARQLVPLVRHFATRFAATQGIARSHITRVEVWTGAVPIPPPGETPEFPAELRREVLNRYRTLTPAKPAATPAVEWTVRHQADLTWQLIHVAEEW